MGFLSKGHDFSLLQLFKLLRSYCSWGFHLTFFHCTSDLNKSRGYSVDISNKCWINATFIVHEMNTEFLPDNLITWETVWCTAYISSQPGLKAEDIIALKPQRVQLTLMHRRHPVSHLLSPYPNLLHEKTRPPSVSQYLLITAANRHSDLQSVRSFLSWTCLIAWLEGHR